VIDRGPDAGVGSDLVDLDRLSAWMGEQGLGPGRITRAERLGGGSQNVLVRFARGDHDYVFRRGPRHLRPTSNEVIRREMRVLRALGPTAVPHPRFVAGCEDDTVLGAAFYLMDVVPGFNATVELPLRHAAEPELRHAMGLSAAEALARLGRLEPAALGLGDLGSPAGWLERQVPRWLAHLDGYGRYEGYSASCLPSVGEIASWLDDNRPRDWRPGLLHGDYHLGNLMYEEAGPAVVAVVDWEMCTIGDPLLDLGLLVATASDDDLPPSPIAGLLGKAGGLPRPEEIVAAYGEQCERDLSCVDWYVVLACFKTAIVAEGTYARALVGHAPRATGELLHSISLGLLDRACSRVSRG
jgi:aminoglycoside phosphotransferase (APT) family kinase protein